MFLLILTGVGSLASYNASFQTVLVKKYLSSLSKKLNTTIIVGEIDVTLFNSLIINDLYVEDLHQDTLFFASRLRVDIAEFSYKKKRIVLDEVELNNTFFNLQKYKNEQTNNLKFIIDHFTTTDSTKSGWYFDMNNVILNNTRFNYDDQHFKKLEYGVDYKHISISYLDLAIIDISFINKGFDCKIKQLNFFEQSGFQVDEFTCDV
ncbi:MAG: hypothetical protein QMB65_10805, partial [Vicingaceae bacterium]